MKVEYFPTRNWYISKRNMELFEDRVQPCRWKVFKCQALGWLHTLYTGLARNIKCEIFRLPGSAWGLLIKVEHFRINTLWISKRNMEKYRTAERLIILSSVTSLQERQRHWQFALQFLFAALHGQQPRPLDKFLSTGRKLQLTLDPI